MVQCDGMQLTKPPFIPAEIRPKIYALGLQRNSIQHIPQDFINQLPNLEKLDVSQQTGGCVYLDQAGLSQDFMIYGK